MITVARTDAPLATIRRNGRPLDAARYSRTLPVARTTPIISLQHFSVPFATIALPHFAENQAGLIGADGSFLQGADGTILQGAEA